MLQCHHAPGGNLRNFQVKSSWLVVSCGWFALIAGCVVARQRHMLFQPRSPGLLPPQVVQGEIQLVRHAGEALVVG